MTTTKSLQNQIQQITRLNNNKIPPSQKQTKIQQTNQNKSHGRVSKMPPKTLNKIRSKGCKQLIANENLWTIQQLITKHGG